MPQYHSVAMHKRDIFKLYMKRIRTAVSADWETNSKLCRPFYIQSFRAYYVLSDGKVSILYLREYYVDKLKEVAKADGFKFRRGEAANFVVNKGETTTFRTDGSSKLTNTQKDFYFRINGMRRFAHNNYKADDLVAQWEFIQAFNSKHGFADDDTMTDMADRYMKFKGSMEFMEKHDDNTTDDCPFS